MKQLLKKLYDSADIDFLMNESIALTEIEFKQTFCEYHKAAEYTYNLLKREGLDAEFITFPADGKTTYQDFRTPLAWEASYGRLTVTKSPIPFADPIVADYERHPFHLIKGSTGTPEGGIHARLLTEAQVLNGADNGCDRAFPIQQIYPFPFYLSHAGPGRHWFYQHLHRTGHGKRDPGLHCMVQCCYGRSRSLACAV